MNKSTELTLAPNWLVEQTSTDGEGLRNSVYLCGCSIHCPECHNSLLWNKSYGIQAPFTEVLDTLLRKDEFVDGVSILGGEPFDQPIPLLALVSTYKRFTGKTVWIYTGYTVEKLFDSPVAREILVEADVVVDGPYMKDNKDTSSRPCGSANQRILTHEEILSRLSAWVSAHTPLHL